jgi:hypothetical protein
MASSSKTLRRLALSLILLGGATTAAYATEEAGGFDVNGFWGYCYANNCCWSVPGGTTCYSGCNIAYGTVVFNTIHCTAVVPN